MGNNFKEKSLKEAKEIVENLIVQTPQGKTFQFESFIQGLSEEIEDLWESGTKNAFVRFHLVEDGSLVYGGLVNELVNNPLNISLPISFRLETYTPSTVKLAEEYLQLDIAEKKSRLLDKLLKEGKDENLQK